MNKKSSISFGPGAASLLLIFVALAMSALGMLSLMNSRNDLRLAQRSAAVMESIYALNVKAEESRAKVDAVLYELAKKQDADYPAAAAEALPEDMKIEGSVISWDETDGTHTIHCALEIQPLGSESRTRWVRHALVSRTAEIAEDQEWERDWRQEWTEDLDLDMGDVIIDD